MKLHGYTILLLLTSCLSSTVSFAQGKDSIKIAVDDLSILAECCIRETGLSKDTTTLSFQNRKCEKLNDNLTRQVCNLEEQRQNSDIAAINLSMGLSTCKSLLSAQKRKTKGFKIGMFTLTPLALIGGIWLGSRIGN